MLTQLKQFTKKSKMIIIAHQIYNNWLNKRRFNSGKTESYSGSTHSGMILSDSLLYINKVFDDYINYANISSIMLRDKKILEIGPGDNMGVALKFLVGGAMQVVCLDKFFSKRNPEQQYKIYQALRESLSDDERNSFDQAINLVSGININSQKLSYIHGIGIEEADSIFEPDSFDFIFSRSVVQLVNDVENAFSVMNRLLAPGGYMIHKIDLRDCGMFTSNGFHPLTFLTIPDSVYRLMVSDSSKPNRRLINYYRQKMTELGHDTTILITHIVGSEGEILPHKERAVYGVDYSDSTHALLDKIRPNLQERFRNMANEELMVAGIFLVSKKP